ncbi:MAG: ATP-binding domain-containing protein [Methylovulum sp.]|nr:ATP-binding domain-containing protein [Methylovulum sp.]
MTTFYPPLEEANKYDPSFDIEKPAFAKLKNDFNCCTVFHRLNIEHRNYLENPIILDWFDFIIFHPKKGIVCIDESCVFSDETIALTMSLLRENDHTLLPERIYIAEDLDDAQKQFESWADIGNYNHHKIVYFYHQKILCFLKNIMQIDSLPPVDFKQRTLIRDKRFNEFSTQYGLVKQIESELITMEETKNEIHLYVNTCAGSGKTISAIHAYRRFTQLGKKPILVCYNHLLGRLLRTTVHDTPSSGYVGTLYSFAHHKRHQLNVTNGVPPNPTDDHVDMLLSELETITIEDTEKYDALIIDEGQDFRDYWVDLLTHYLKPGASVLWFEDDSQSIEFDDRKNGLNGIPAVLLRKINMLLPKEINKKPNYRVTKFIEDFLIKFFPIYTKSFNLQKPFFEYEPEPSIIRVTGRKPQINFYQKERLLEKLKERLDELINKDHIALSDIEIISCLPDSENNPSHSLLLAKNNYSVPFQYLLKDIDGYSLKRTTGVYKDGEKVYKEEGGILCESIARYKGLEAPVVLVIDVEIPDGFSPHDWVQFLYCALTRAKMHLEIFVCSDGKMNECFKATEEAINQ